MLRLIAGSITLLCLCGLDGSRAEARARRPKAKARPRLLVTVAGVTDAQGAAADLLSHARKILAQKLAAHPLVVTTLGLKDPTPRKVGLALRRRRLRHYRVGLRLDQVKHQVVKKGAARQLTATAAVTLQATLVDRRKKDAFPSAGQGTFGLPVSVVLHAETLACRLAALRAAITRAIGRAVTTALTPRRRRKTR